MDENRETWGKRQEKKDKMKEEQLKDGEISKKTEEKWQRKMIWRRERTHIKFGRRKEGAIKKVRRKKRKNTENKKIEKSDIGKNSEEREKAYIYNLEGRKGGTVEKVIRRERNKKVRRSKKIEEKWQWKGKGEERNANKLCKKERRSDRKE